MAHWDIRRPAGTKLPKCSVRTQIGFLDPVRGPKRDKPGTTNYSIFMPTEDISGPVKFFISIPEDEEEDVDFFPLILHPLIPFAILSLFGGAGTAPLFVSWLRSRESDD